MNDQFMGQTCKRADRTVTLARLAASYVQLARQLKYLKEKNQQLEDQLASQTMYQPPTQYAVPYIFPS